MPIKDYIHTITSDNGKEFSQHEFVAKSLDASLYFATPYHSWQRGVNENYNRLLRQYFPKRLLLKTSHKNNYWLFNTNSTTEKEND